jgi:hypothetical protein
MESDSASDGIASPVSGASIPDLKAGYQESREAKKDKKPRKKKDVDVDTEKRDAFLSGFVVFSNMALKMICARMPTPLPPTPEETEMFNTSVTAVMTKYFSTFANWDAELSLVIAMVFIFIPRMKKEEEETDAASSGDDFGKDRNGQDGSREVVNREL